MVLVLSLAGVGCAGRSGGSIVDIEVRMATVSERSSPAGHEVTDGAGAPVTVGAAVAQVDRIDFTLPAGTVCADLDPATFAEGVVCDGVDTIRVDEDRVADLVAGTMEPSLDGIVIPAYAYSRVDVRFATADGDPLLGEDTMHVEADTDDGPVSVALRFSEDARFERDGGIDADTAAAALLLLDVDAWFGAADLGACAAGGGRIDEDADGPCDLEGDLRDAIKESGQLAQDDDGDGLADDVGDDHGGDGNDD